MQRRGKVREKMGGKGEIMVERRVAAANDGMKVEDAMACRLPYDKMKSISTGDILDTSGNAGWLLKCTSPDSIERRVLRGVGAVPGDYHFTVRHSLVSVYSRTSVKRVRVSRVRSHGMPHRNAT